MTFSVNTNVGALTALQYLSNTQASLSMTQSHINSGMKGSPAMMVRSSLSRRTSALRSRLRGRQRLAQSRFVRCGRGSRPASRSPSSDPLDQGAVRCRPVARHGQPPGDGRTSWRCVTRSAPSSRTPFNSFNLVDGSTTQITALASADGTRRITTAAQNVSCRLHRHRKSVHHPTQSKASTLVATIRLRSRT